MNEPEARALLAHMCEGKTPYGADTANVQAARAMERNGDGMPVRKYLCAMCGAWHIGHVPSMDGIAAIAEALRVVQGCAPGAPSGTTPRRERKRRRKVHA